MTRTKLPISVATVERLAAQGHTEGEIAQRLLISPDTLTRRKQDTADIAEAINRGRESAHSTVSAKLFDLCQAGNVTAIIWYEKTRRGFKDTTTQEYSGDLTVKVVYADSHADADPPPPP